MINEEVIEKFIADCPCVDINCIHNQVKYLMSCECKIIRELEWQIEDLESKNRQLEDRLDELM